MNVSLTPEFEKYVDQKVKSGDFTSASEVIRTALRLLKEHDAEYLARLDALRQAVGKGVDQARRGQTRDGADVFATIRGRSKKVDRPRR